MTFEQAIIAFVDDLIRIVREINDECLRNESALALLDRYIESNES